MTPPASAGVGTAGRRGLFALLAALVVTTGAVAAEPEEQGPIPPEPSDYRMDNYRSQTPLTLRGAEVVGTGAAEALWRTKAAVFIDTMPRDAKPASLPAGTVWRDKPRDHIPGSAWLANVGYGVVNPEMTEYFRSGLETLSGGDKTRPLLFYCRAACWMSWNAGKRALEWGYTRVLWYPEGTDGWSAAGLPMEPAKPFARAGEASGRR